MIIQPTLVRPPAGAPPLAGAERRDGRALLSRAVDAFREGGRAAAPAPPGQTNEQINGELLAYVYASLTRADHPSVAKVAGICERALELGRAGRQEEAEATMKLARFFLSVAGFSTLGRAAADTLHQAAEAYLSYRGGDFGDASARLAAAVEATDRLADAWGESRFTTGRRVHLLHNLMKVEARRGASREAATLGAGILGHLVGSSAGPCLPVLARPAPALERAIADRFCDVVAATVAEVLAEVPDAEAKELLGLLAGVAPGETPTAARAWAWLPLKAAALDDDPRCFLEGAAPFLRAGRGRAPVLWYAVAFDVVRAARGRGAVPVPDAVAEIAAELNADPRVPKCMQAAARGPVPMNAAS